MTTENLHSEPQDNNVNNTESIVNENITPEKNPEPETHEEEIHDEVVEQHEHEKLTSGELMNQLEALINAEDAGANHRKFNAIKETLVQRANLEIEELKHQHESEGKQSQILKTTTLYFLKYPLLLVFSKKNTTISTKSKKLSKKIT